MGVFYYHSKKEKEERKKEIKKRGLRLFHTDFVDEKGNPTSGTSGRLIFGTEEQEEKSTERKFTRPASIFFSELESIKTFMNVYPLMYENYEEFTTNELKKKIGTDSKDLTSNQLLSLYHFRLSQNLKYLSREQRNQYVPDEVDQLMIAVGKNKMFLPRSQSFVREMSLVYLISIFNGYIIKILYEVFRANKELLKLNSGKKNFHKIIDSKNEDFFEEELYEFISKDLVGYGMENLSKEFKKFFGFEFKGNNWEKFSEYFERRNVIVHHEGIPSKRYKKKFPKYAKLEKLEISKEYLIQAIKSLESYQQRINGFFWSNYGEMKYLEEMSK